MVSSPFLSTSQELHFMHVYRYITIWVWILYYQICFFYLSDRIFLLWILNQGSKNAIKVITDIYHERKATKIAQNDFLDRVIEEVEKENAFLDDGVAINMLFLLLFGAFESTSEAITLLTKFISDHPQVLEELTVSRYNNTSLFLLLTCKKYRWKKLIKYWLFHICRKSMRRFLKGEKIIRILDLHGKNINQWLSPIWWVVVRL